MSETPSVDDIRVSKDPVIGPQQDAVVARARKSIADTENIKPRNRLNAAIHRVRAERFKSGRIYAADLMIEGTRQHAESQARHIEEKITAKRKQVPVIRAFFDTSTPGGVISKEQLEPDTEQNVAKTVLLRIALAAKQRAQGLEARPLPIFDSRSPLPDCVSGNNSRIAVAVLSELGLGPESFVETAESTDAATVMEAVMPFGPAPTTAGHPVNRNADIKVCYEQQGLDAALTLTVVDRAPAQTTV